MHNYFIIIGPYNYLCYVIVIVYCYAHISLLVYNYVYYRLLWCIVMLNYYIII